MKYIRDILFLLVLFHFCTNALAQEVNYEESKVPDYSLPDPLIFNNGDKVTTAKEWKRKRRPEILRHFKTQVYGKSPKPPKAMHFKVTSMDTNMFGGKATRKQVSIYFKAHNKRPRMDLLIYIPNDSQPAPAFLGLNFKGNQGIYPDPDIIITDQWVRSKDVENKNHRATKATRGDNQGLWPVEAIMDRGYALITAYYGDLDPDYNDGFRNGIQPLFYKMGQSHPASDGWGAIGAWAWGLSRAMDYLVTDKDIDAYNTAVIGHSRLGKAALWAGAQDQRFALVISNSSGCGGAALSRRRYGETVEDINTGFPHWFCDNFNKYNNNEDALPIDQHELLALIAPRPVYVQTSSGDRWADPRGQFLACKYASPVYHLLGFRGLTVDHMPELNQPIMKGKIGFHIRAGRHMQTLYDWERYMDFADRYLKSLGDPKEADLQDY